MPRPVCVYDANVLYPAQLRDLLMRLAVRGVVRAHWSEDIHEEWTRNILANHPDLQRSDVRRTRQLMDRALPDACVEEYEHRLESIALPDPDDRHVLAAALEVEATWIVTFNLRDFPVERLQPYGIEALHPDALLLRLLGKSENAVIDVMRSHRMSLRNPRVPVDSYLQMLQRVGLSKSIDVVDQRSAKL